MAKVDLDDLRIEHSVYDSSNGTEPDKCFYKFQSAFNYVERACSLGSWICMGF